MNSISFALRASGNATSGLNYTKDIKLQEITLHTLPDRADFALGIGGVVYKGVGGERMMRWGLIKLHCGLCELLITCAQGVKTAGIKSERKSTRT